MKPTQTEQETRVGSCFGNYDPFVKECAVCIMKQRCLSNTMDKELGEMFASDKDNLQAMS
jgi:hypothetical protein